MIETNRKTLLNHWFHYYGHVPYTFEELNIFEKLLNEQEDKIRMYILFAALGPKINNRVATTEYLIAAIRDKSLDKLLNNLKTFESIKDKEELEYLLGIEEQLLEEYEQTYINPEVPNYIDIDEILNPGESAAVINLDNLKEKNRGIIIYQKRQL